MIGYPSDTSIVIYPTMTSRMLQPISGDYAEQKKIWRKSAIKVAS